MSCRLRRHASSTGLILLILLSGYRRTSRLRAMPDQRYEAGRQTLGALLSTTSPRTEVPDWQRSYSWGSAEVGEFWDDLVAFDKQYPGKNITGEEYFLGSIVLVRRGLTNLLLDGQQRLATATILLSVLRDARQDYSNNAATRLQNKYISDFDDATNTTTHVLTLNVYDRHFFRSEVQDEVANQRGRPKATLKSHGLIRKARQYFEARVVDASQSLGRGEAAFQWNLRIGKVLCDHMSVVAVSSTDEDNAASVFETLNDRGIGLSTPDLLRTLLIRRADDDAARERIINAWQAVLAINEEASVDEFLRHYWVSLRGDVKGRKLYREIKHTVTNEDMDSLTLSLDLADTAPLYRDISRAREEDPDLRRTLESLRLLGAKALYPVLLSGYAVADSDDEKEKLRILGRALTTLFVRYNVIGGRETSVLESTAYYVASKLRATGDFDTAVAALSDLAPDALDFVRRFQRASISRMATARYLLREIEHAIRRTQEVAVEGTDRVHVEHIYPRTPESNRWPNHTAMINRLGNLTLLGRRLNTSIQNADFATKQDKAYRDSDILMTRELADEDIWDPAAIETRQRRLSAYAFGIWSFPGEAPPAIQARRTRSWDDESLGDLLFGDDVYEPVVEDEAPDQLPEFPTG
jgi:hypothetical protein